MEHEHTMGESTCLKKLNFRQNFMPPINLNKLTSNSGWTFTMYVLAFWKIKPRTPLQASCVI